MEDSTPSAASERLGWAVELLEVQPNEQLLEVGCGQGVAVSLVCASLQSGSVTALDRSEKMIAAAKRRNAEHVASGKASFITASLAKADFAPKRFDKIFAVRVGAFVQGNAARELEIVKRCLAEGGRFYIIYDPPDPRQGSRLEGFAFWASGEKSLYRAKSSASSQRLPKTRFVTDFLS